MTVRVPSTGYAQQLVNAGDGPSLIINRDLVTSLILSHDNAQISNRTILGDPTLSIVDPLGSITVNGQEAIFGLAASGSIEVDVKKGASYWAPSPAQVAAQINALGLAKDTSVNNPSFGPAKDTTVANVHTDIALGTNQFLSGASASAIAGAGSTVAKDVGNTGLNAALPVKQTSFGPFAANTSWGPTAVTTFPLGGAYKLVITPQVAATAFVTDLTVQHQDANGTTVYTEDFTISNIGNSGLTGGLSALGGVIVRGNLQGTKLILSGLTISSANLSTITGGAFATATGINIAVYYDSHFLPESKPKVVPWVNTGYLAFVTNLALAGSATFNYGVLPSYSGLVSCNLRSAGAGAGTFARIDSISVINGTTPLYSIWINESTGTTNMIGPLTAGIDQLLHRFQVTNATTTADTVNASVVAQDFV